MKVDAKIYKGIEYVQLNELPQSQREKLIQTINSSLFIKIMIDGKIISDCLQYKDYGSWYENVYAERSLPAIEKEVSVRETIEIKPDLALTKF